MSLLNQVLSSLCSQCIPTSKKEGYIFGTRVDIKINNMCIDVTLSTYSIFASISGKVIQLIDVHVSVKVK